jgi:ketosteroid isomerase-like protein
MSRENVELIYRAYDALTRRDVHAFLELMHPEIEATSRILEVEGAVYKCHSGMRELIEGIWSVFPNWRSEVLGVRAVSDDLVVATVRNQGKGAASGVEIDMTAWQVVKFRDGKPILLRPYETEAQALEAVGLRE